MPDSSNSNFIDNKLLKNTKSVLKINDKNNL